MAANPIKLQSNNLFGCLSFSNESIAVLFDCLFDLRPDHGLFGELSVAFMDDAELVRIHAEFLQDSTLTDVITFPGDPRDGIAGEICVSVERAEMESIARCEPFAQELTLYLVHGWLHLLGFEDVSDSDRRSMRQAEQDTMTAIEKAGVIPDFRLAKGSSAE